MFIISQPSDFSLEIIAQKRHLGLNRGPNGREMGRFLCVEVEAFSQGVQD